MEEEKRKKVKMALMSLLSQLYKNGFNDDMGGGVLSDLYHTILQFDKLLNFDIFLELCYKLGYIEPNVNEELASTILKNNRWALSQRVKRLFKLNSLLDDW